MEEKLDIIIQKLEEIEIRIDKLEQEMCSLSKHAPFVDSLAKSGVVKTIKSFNGLLSSINPIKYINYTPEIKN